jgi:hypothetical protein
MRRCANFEEENRRLKSIVANQARIFGCSRTLLAKKLQPAVKRQMVAEIMTTA